MMRLDFLLFLGVATAAHLALWPELDLSGPAGGGAGGENSVTLAASAPVADLVEHWETPPETATSIPMLDAPPAPDVPQPPPAENAPKAAPRPELIEPAPITPSLPQATRSVPPVEPPDMATATLSVPRVDAATPRTAPQTIRPARPAAPTALPRPDQPQPPELDRVAAATDSPLAPARSIQPPARPAQRQEPAAAPAQPVQTATGPSGQAELSGPAAAQPSQGADRATTQRLMAQWGSGVQRAIERRKRYPRGTRASGTVRLRLTLNGAGQLTGIGLAASSGHTALDQAAMAAVRAARYPAAPEPLGPGPHAFTVPLSFRP
ncbi:energy transducer TonB family protein [Salibaculum griseiflavum]|uniref:TonB C-terminal domain-containing protein n=1 Tax=Salibaculum griseiflavum TaxID=1914409 RepID=A0A2V1P604_9RHOB|nr:TonB family protein [Salibaculum griseiflavum]PWG17254.1 hypothetical protein DFK10_07655 [Salibaculum griseiflavum]